MAFPKKLKELCTPALVYFIVSVVSMTVVLLQNIGNKNSYTLGSFTCRVPNTALIFIMKLIYVLFWTWILNLICKDGNTAISWILVLVPFILLFIILGLIMMNKK
jgi:hypothetical protein